jgi:hypothetical protein
MTGYVSEAFGGISTGFLYSFLVSDSVGWSQIEATNFFFYVYALFGFLKVIAYWSIDNSKSIEAKIT